MVETSEKTAWMSILVNLVLVGIKAWISIFLDSIRVLLDASLDFASQNKIRELVLSNSKVLAINGLWARNAGRYKFVELDLTLRVNDLQRGHQVANELENKIKLAISQVDRVLIHYQPQPKEQLVYAIPLVDDQQTISDHFGEAPFFRLLRLKSRGGEIVEDHILHNPCLQEEKGKGIKVVNWLLEKGIDVVIARQDQSGKGPGFVLGNAGAEILLTRETDCEKAVAAVQSDQRIKARYT